MKITNFLDDRLVGPLPVLAHLLIGNTGQFNAFLPASKVTDGCGKKLLIFLANMVGVEGLAAIAPSADFGQNLI
ncbi:MAG: hypothetical protein EB060_11645 [Proteobacteria bacterium]|nr:hypothetical protein [Pseudomonadota bacterium]